MAGNSRGREPSLRRKRALRGGHASISPLRRTRSLHHRHVDLQNGELARPGTLQGPRGPRSTRSTTELQASLPDGNRTRDRVVKSEVPGPFTTARQGEVGERARRKRHPLRKALLLPARPVARVATPIATGASTVRSRMPVSPPRGAAVARSIRTLHHRQKFPGEQPTRPLAFSRTKESASSPPGVKNSPLLLIQGLRKGGKQKPLRSVGSGRVRSDRTVEWP